MTRTKGIGTAWGMAFLLLASFSTPTGAAAQGAREKKMVYTHVKHYVLDFTKSQHGGVAGGNMENVAFNLDLRKGVRKVALCQGERTREVIPSFDYADCTRGQESLLEKPLASLAPGTPAWVDYVDLEMLPHPQKDLKWTGGVCYGYRTTRGIWHWHLAPTVPLTYDAASGKVRARLWIKEPEVDALKLVFDKTVPRQFISNVSVAVPASAGAPK